MQLTTCSKPAVNNLLQVCSSQLAASLQFTICSKSAVDNLQQVCSSQLAASLQFATCSKSAVRNLQQVCSSQLAASLLTACSRLVVIKPEQAMRTHPDIGLMIATCSKSAADLLQLARFWLCKVADVDVTLVGSFINCLSGYREHKNFSLCLCESGRALLTSQLKSPTIINSLSSVSHLLKNNAH